MTVQALIRLLETFPPSVEVKSAFNDELSVKLEKERASDNPTMPDEDNTYLLVY